MFVGGLCVIDFSLMADVNNQVVVKFSMHI